MSKSSPDTPVTAENSAIWKDHVTVPDTPPGFTVRTTYPGNPDGVEVMLEQWEPGSAEPPHSHAGDDMTVVIEGRMAVQFFTSAGGQLIPDGEPLILNRGGLGLPRAMNRAGEPVFLRCLAAAPSRAPGGESLASDERPLSESPSAWSAKAKMGSASASNICNVVAPQEVMKTLGAAIEIQ